MVRIKMTKLINMNRCIKITSKYAKQYKYRFIIAELCIIILYSVSLILPWNLTRLVDNVVYEKNYSLLTNIIIVYFVLFLISTITNFFYAYIWQTLNNKYVVKIKTDMYEKLLRSKSKFLSGLNTGDAVARVEWDSDQFIHVIQRNVFHLANSLIMCVVIIVFICINSIIMGVFAVASVLIPIIITKVLSKKTERLTQKSRHNAGILTGKVFELFSGFREIKLFNAQLWAEKQVLSPLEKMFDANNKQNIISLSIQKAALGVSICFTLAQYILGAILVVNGHMTIGVFLAIIQYVSLLNYKFDWILTIYNDWHWRKISLNRCCEILECESEQNNGTLITHIDSIEFKNVSFAYDDKLVLSNISFKINKGENVGLVGVSGVGKTTLISLLTKLYKPQSGEILINGKNIESIDTYNLRNVIGIVSQDIKLFNDTIAYNLTFGKQIPDNKIESALKKAQIHETVANLPQKLETVIDENNVGLSGGQAQRIMIARMLIKNADMYICDEATSALDVNTECEIVSELKSIMQGKIGITISHRYQSLVNCDKIIVLKNGEIDAVGTDAELMSCSDEYSSLFGGVVHA